MPSYRDRRFLEWLEPSRSASASGHYRHARLDEAALPRATGLDALADTVVAAHDDACRWFADLLADTLDPFDVTDVPANYPHGLHTLTLQGYLGEIFAGVLA